MIFAVDIGNTNVVIGIFEKGSIRCNFRVQSSTLRTTDEYAAIILRLMESEGIKPSDISGVIIASVVPRLIYTFNKFARKYMDLDPIVIHTSFD